MNLVEPKGQDSNPSEPLDRPRPPTSWTAFAAFIAVWLSAQGLLDWLGAPKWAAVAAAFMTGGLALWPMGLAQQFIRSPIRSGLARLARRRGWAEWTPARWALLWVAGAAWLAGLLLLMDTVFDALGFP